MGGYAWWHHYSQGKKCVALWGAESGELIRYGSIVELLQVESRKLAGDETIKIGGSEQTIIAQRDITATPGLVHARQALIEDASFLWKELPEAVPQWQYVMRFTEDEKQVAVAIDCQHGYVRLIGTDKQATLNQHLRTGYSKRLPVWLGNSANSASTNQPVSSDTP